MAKYKDMGEFWDTHDLTEFTVQENEVEFEVDIQPEVTYYAIDIDPDVLYYGLKPACMEIECIGTVAAVIRRTAATVVFQ